MALSIGLAESRIELLVADTTFSFETDRGGGGEDSGSRGNDDCGDIFDLLLVQVVGHHGLKSLLEVREFAHEVFGKH